LSVARGQTQYPFVPLEIQGPTALDEEVTYGYLSDTDVDTILEISLRKCDLRGERSSINPPLHLLMAAGIRLIRTTEEKVLYSRVFVYEHGSNLRKFSEWGVNNAQPFGEELDSAFQYVAMEIVNVLSDIQTPVDPQSNDLDG